MPLDDLSETLKDLAIKVYLVNIPANEELRVRELVKELKSLLDASKTTDGKPIYEIAAAHCLFGRSVGVSRWDVHSEQMK